MKDKHLILVIIASAILCYVLMSRGHSEELRFQRYAYLSEAENDLSEKWFRQDKVLWTWLFMGGDKNFIVSKERAERMEDWRRQDPKIFRVMLNKAWVEIIPHQKVISL